MTDYQKILRLCRSGLGNNPIAKAVGCKWDTVERTLTKCEECWGTIKDVPTDLSNEEIEKVINRPNREADDSYLKPDCGEVSKKAKAGEKKADLWARYVSEAKSKGLKAYSISRFNEIIHAYETKHNITSRLYKEPGVECQVDWCGDTGMLVDRFSGEVTEVYIFVMSLPYSGYFYCEGFLDMKMGSWLQAHSNAFSFFGGVPYITVPDNCKTAVIRSGNRDDDPVINSQYAEYADHYKTVISPARVRRPKDKASVERHVRVVEEGILPDMEKLDFFTLQEFNAMLRKKMMKVLEAPLSRRDGSRSSIFHAEEKERLMPLPVYRFEPYTEKEAVVGRDYHIQFDSAFYSLPPTYIGDKVKVRATSSEITICTLKGTEITRHPRADHKWQRVTNKDHIPASYIGLGGYSRENFIGIASRYGANATAWVNMVLDSFEFEVQGYRTVATALKYAKSYVPEAVEEACCELVASGIRSSKGFRTILMRAGKNLAEKFSSEEDINSLFCSHEEVEG